MPGPEGYRKAMRVMALADKLDIPVDHPHRHAGRVPRAPAPRSAARAARSRAACRPCSACGCPSIAVVIGEGSSGGALALGVADRVMMLENSTYSVISPEGGRGHPLARRGAGRATRPPAFQPTAANCYRWGIADVVVPEPRGGAHRDHDEAARLLGGYLARALRELQRAVAGRAPAPAPRPLPAHRGLPRGGVGDPAAMAAGRSDPSSNGGAATS